MVMVIGFGVWSDGRGRNNWESTWVRLFLFACQVVPVWGWEGLGVCPVCPWVMSGLFSSGLFLHWKED